MPVYDDQETRQDNHETDSLNDITGIGPEEEKRMEDSAYSGAADDISEREKLDEKTDEDFKYSDESAGKKVGRQSKVRGWMSKKSNQAIMAVTVSVIAGIMTLSFIALPTLVINHLREVLLSVSNLQVDQTRKYRRSKIGKINDMFTQDGRRASKLVAEMEGRGYKATFDGNKLLGFTDRSGRSTTFSTGTTELVESHINEKHPLRSARWKTKRMEAMYSRYNIPRKSVVLLADDAGESADRIINKRIAEGILDDDAVTAKSAPQGEATDETEADRNARNTKNEYAKELIDKDGSLDQIREKLKSGTPLSELDADERAILRIGVEFDDELINTVNGFADVGVGGKLASGIKGVAGSAVTEIADKVCTVKGRLNAAMFAARVYRARALMQYASIFISASDQTRIGGSSSVMMGELMKRVTSADKNGAYIGSSSGFSNLLKGKFSKSKNDSLKSNYSVDGSLTGIAGAFHNTTKNIPGTNQGQCAVWQNPATQIGAGALELGIGVLTGGAGKGASAGIGESIKLGFNAAMKNIISKQTLKSLAKTAAIEFTFEGAMTLLQIQAQKALSLNFTGQEKGGQLGEILAGGTGTMNKQRSLMSGMVPATTKQYAQALNDHEQYKRENMKGQSFFARVFDYNNTDSLAFKTASLAFASPSFSTDPGASISNMAKSFITSPTTLLSSAGNVFSNSAVAQNSDEIAYDSLTIEGTNTTLATDQAGNLLPVMREDIEAIDPEVNIQELISSGDISPGSFEPISTDFKEHVANCVDNIDTLSVLEKNAETTDPKVDCLATQPKTVKYKAHLAYLDMVDGIDATLFPEEIASSKGAKSTSSTANVDVTEPSFAKNPNVKVDGSPPGAHKASNCTGTFTEGAASLKAIIAEKWTPPVSSIGGYSCRGIVGGSSTSLHGLGRAIDVMINANTEEGLAKGNEIRNWVINNSTQLGVQRVIWNRYTWAANKDGWNPYTGSNDHTDHLHIEINLEASVKSDLGR